LTAAEQGLLLLCCRLEDDVQPLTLAQFRTLRQRVLAHRRPEDGDRELCRADLEAIGCSGGEADRILMLLDRRDVLEAQRRTGITACTWLGETYPRRLRERLGDDAPPVLFLLGDPGILQRDAIALVGSRDLTPLGRRYAEAVGRMAAESGYVLVSGNARGADRTAQDACLAAGGTVLSVVADRLLDYRPRAQVLYVSEEGPGVGFSAGRALRRNRLIHAAGRWTFVAQVRDGQGGTWDGSVRNLRHGWSPLFVPQDGSAGAETLCRLGATPISLEQLQTLTQ